jgi:hypothetical protein
VSQGGALQRFARRAAETSRELAEKCDFCTEPIAMEHRHLLESSTRSVVCVCQACTLLFATPAASLGKYRLIPDRRVYLADLEITDAEWDSLHVPVGICFVTAGRAYYPGPMGPTEAPVDPAIWSALTRRYPPLADIEPEVEALLVNRTRGHRDYFIAPIDVCFSLTGLIRVHWRGLSGGTAVWTEIAAFFEALHTRSRTHRLEPSACPSATT